MTMDFTSIDDARTCVDNSGVVDWDWGGRDADAVLERLARFLRLHGGECADFDAALIRFVRDDLGDNPAGYSIGR